MKTVPVIVITGACGVGKTTTAFAMSEKLCTRGVPHAVIDMDTLRNCEPAPPHDPFHMELGYRNLAAVWENYRQVGTEYLVLADIVESHLTIDDYHKAVPGSQVVVVRLRVSREENERRLRGRETEASIDWYLNRSAELAEQMEAQGIGDIVIDTDGCDVGEVAEKILSEVEMLVTLSAKPETPEPLGLYHDFYLVPISDTNLSMICPDAPHLSLSDDVVQYLHQAWQWVPIRNHFKNTEIHFGLYLYAQTVITRESAIHFARICEAYSQLFAQAPDEFVLNHGFLCCSGEWCDEAEQCESYAFRVKRDELVTQLDTLRDWGNKAATGEYFILHNGV